MIITLTPAQADELTNGFWHISYTVTIEGVEVTAHTDDDDLREIPNGVDVGDLGVDDPDNPTEYYMSHPALDWRDEVLIKEELDVRAAFTATVRAAAQPERAGLRQAERARLRTEARQDARRTARVAQRRAAWRAARREARQAARRAARRAARLAFEETHAAALAAAQPSEPS